MVKTSESSVQRQAEFDNCLCLLKIVRICRLADWRVARKPMNMSWPCFIRSFSPCDLRCIWFMAGLVWDSERVPGSLLSWPKSIPSLSIRPETLQSPIQDDGFRVEEMRKFEDSSFRISICDASSSSRLTRRKSSSSSIVLSCYVSCYTQKHLSGSRSSRRDM